MRVQAEEPEATAGVGDPVDWWRRSGAGVLEVKAAAEARSGTAATVAPERRRRLSHLGVLHHHILRCRLELRRPRLPAPLHSTSRIGLGCRAAEAVGWGRRRATDLEERGGGGRGGGERRSERRRREPEAAVEGRQRAGARGDDGVKARANWRREKGVAGGRRRWVVIEK